MADIGLLSTANIVTGILLVLLFAPLISRLYYISMAKVVPIEKAAWMLYHHWASEPSADKTIPVSLQGVFFMDGNVWPESVLTFMSGKHDSANHTLTLQFHNSYNWAYNNSFQGWMEYVMVCLWSYNSVVVFKFDEEYKSATGLTYAWRCMRFPCTFGMERLDAAGDAWSRDGVYTMRKIIDASGMQLPAFALMEKKVKEGTPPVKPPLQIVQGSRCCGQGPRGEMPSKSEERHLLS